MDDVERLTHTFPTRADGSLNCHINFIDHVIGLCGVLIYKKHAGIVELTGLFESSGLITYYAGRLLAPLRQGWRKRSKPL